MEQGPVVESSESQAPAVEEAGETKPKCKACCACPETKKERDQW
jgi:hypothetical protein